MAWCPVCRSEYRPGITACPQCEVPLTQALPDKPQEQFVLLATFLDERLKDQALAALRTAGIPVYLRDRGAGSFVRITTGSSVFGSALYVPISCLKPAREQIARFLLPPDSEPCDPQALEQAYDEYMRGEAVGDADEAPAGENGYRLLYWFLGIFAALVLVALALRLL